LILQKTNSCRCKLEKMRPFVATTYNQPLRLQKLPELWFIGPNMGEGSY
jgi:hypothetical protein